VAAAEPAGWGASATEAEKTTDLPRRAGSPRVAARWKLHPVMTGRERELSVLQVIRV
jgi:hypothetical protein